MNAAKLIRQLKKDMQVSKSLVGDNLTLEDMQVRGAIAALNFLLDEGLNDLDDYERIRTLKEDLERER